MKKQSKTKFILTTKCYMIEYDQIMNQTLLQYQEVEMKCKNFPSVFPGCFDFLRNTTYHLIVQTYNKIKISPKISPKK